MFLIAGLGNPGAKYSGSRHNVGFRLIEELTRQLSVQMKTGKGAYLNGKKRYKDQKLLLVQPTTFINNSGDAIRQAVDWYKIPPENCLICYDDLNLEVGSLRIRTNGSAGGHNGVKDIIQKLGTDKFPRLRIGIGNDFNEGEQIQFVLSAFKKDEAPIIENAIDNAANAVLKYVTEGAEATMDMYN